MRRQATNAALALGTLVLAACGGDTKIEQVDGGPSCDEGTLTACICGDGEFGRQACEQGKPGACDCDNPVSFGECREDATPAVCRCPGDVLGEQPCVDGAPGDCECPDPPPAGQCRSDLDCNDGVFCNGVERCAPAAADADMRGCTPATVGPVCDDGIACTLDRCSDELNRCVSVAPDADGDGHPDGSCTDGEGIALGDDCDDGDDNRFPGNPEVCREGDFTHDEDCNDATFGKLDLDADGVVDDRCCNGDNCGGDCDDATIARRAGQPEFCDNRDNDCDGIVDEETGAVPWYVDADGDGFGGVDGIDDAVDQCVPVPGRSLLATDCNDDNPGKHPAQLERCDLRDNNCNLIADEEALCPYDPFPVAPDDQGGVDVGGGNPICPPFGYDDQDGDGYGNTDSGISLDPDAQDCGLPMDWVTMPGDCDDSLANVNPGEIDVCDLVDNDCDGVTDQEPEATETCALANVEAACVFGECVRAQGAMCEPPFDDCDGLEANGCETDTRSAAAHCGGCGMACGLGDLCIDSSCAGSPYQEIVAGENYTLVRRPGGLIGWGGSSDFQLGTAGNVWAPQRVGTIGGVNQVSAGGYHACLRSAGVVRCWGQNYYGQIGNGISNNNDIAQPTTVMGIDDAVLVRAGATHSCAIRADQSVWCWGRASAGQLGYSAAPAPLETLPVQVLGIDDAIDLGLGDAFTCVLHAGGTVSCFGENDYGRLGFDAGTNLNEFLPVVVPGLDAVERFAIGGALNAHMCAILATGAVVCWGYNNWGQLGIDSKISSFAPAAFREVTSARAVSVGYAHTCVVETDGKLWCAGADDVAQLGHPEDQGNGQYPKLVDLGGELAVDVACGRRHTCALLDSGRVICFGNNQYGQIGAGGSTSSATGVYPFRETLPAP